MTVDIIALVTIDIIALMTYWFIALVSIDIKALMTYLNYCPNMLAIALLTIDINDLVHYYNIPIITTHTNYTLLQPLLVSNHTAQYQHITPTM